MKIDRNSILGKIAFNSERDVDDDCSLARAVVLGMLRVIGIYIFIPMCLLIAAIVPIIIGIELGTYPTIMALDGVEIQTINTIKTFPLIVSVWVITCTLIGLLILYNLIPIAGVVIGIGWALWVGYDWMAKTVKNNVRNPLHQIVSSSTIINVTSQMFSNWHRKICSPVEVFNSLAPVGLVNGARVLVGGHKEGIVSALSFNHHKGTATFELTTAGGPDELSSFVDQYDWVSIKFTGSNVIVLSPYE